MAKFVRSGDDTSTYEVDIHGKPIRNRWQWSWLTEISEDGQTFDVWCKKLVVGGQCYCTVCDKVIIYGSAGKKALKKHANLEDHRNAVQSVLNNQKLNGASTVTSLTRESMQDRGNEVKAVISLFLAEHCLPFTLGPELLKLCQRLSKDVTALNSTTLSRQSVTYITSHGVGKAVREELQNKLKDAHFSLNIDEATNNAGNKFLNVIVQYFDEEDQTIKSQLLGTREVNLATSENITAAITDILSSMRLCWTQVISTTMDNCNVMRGKRDGVETKIRRINTNLLDVSGDTLHMVNNAVKKFFVPIEKFFSFQTLASDIYYDIEESPKVRTIFRQLQNILCNDQKAKAVFRPIPNRFLQMHTVSERILDLWECLTVYYSAFLSEREEKKFKAKLDSICSHLCQNQKEKLINILNIQKKQAKTECSLDRKSRILNAVFDNEERTFLIATLYKGIIHEFLSFSKKYQSNKPLVHDLHTDLCRLIKESYAGFLAPDKIPASSVTKLVNLEFKSEIQLQDRDLSVGKFCRPILLKCLKDQKKNEHLLKEFFDALRNAHISMGEYLKKLPVLNKTITDLSYLSPALQRNSKTASAINSLAEKLPNVIPPSALGDIDIELRAYTVDDVLARTEVNEESQGFRLDSDWWALVFNRKSNGVSKYPLVSKLVKALLTIFCGPIVEGSFNIMDDILEDDRNRLTTYNYESLAFIKSHLSAQKQNACSRPITDEMKQDVSRSFAAYQKFKEKDILLPSTSAAPEPSASISASKAQTSIQTPATPQPMQPSASSTATDSRASSPLAPGTAKETLSLKRKQVSLENFFSKKPRI